MLHLVDASLQSLPPPSHGALPVRLWSKFPSSCKITNHRVSAHPNPEWPPSTLITPAKTLFYKVSFSSTRGLSISFWGAPGNAEQPPSCFAHSDGARRAEFKGQAYTSPLYSRNPINSVNLFFFLTEREENDPSYVKIWGSWENNNFWNWISPFD